MRLTHTVSLTVALGPSLTPALTFGEEEPLVENQPNPDSEIAPHVTEAKIDAASRAPEIIKLLREKVKYVFVIFQENRAFDQMFGTFPGAHGLFSQSESETPYDPNNTQLSRGPRVPLLVISPYAQTHIVSNEVGDTNSIIKFINLIFKLPALADLPDEQQALARGKEIYNQDNLGPKDDPNSSVGDLTSAFSISRLRGHDVLPSSYVLIPDADITKLPQWGENPLKTHLHLTPTDSGRPNRIPADFNPRPSSQPNYPN